MTSLSAAVCTVMCKEPGEGMQRSIVPTVVSPSAIAQQWYFPRVLVTDLHTILFHTYDIASGQDDFLFCTKKSYTPFSYHQKYYGPIKKNGGKPKKNRSGNLVKRIKVA